MNRIRRYFQMFKIFCIKGGYKRGEYLRRINYFKNCGDHFFAQPWNFGSEPYYISFGNNVHVASGVSFINHDVTSKMFSYIDWGGENKYEIRFGEIHIGDNVFIGSNSTILYDVNIGNNVVIGAGSLVCSDIPDNSVAAGNPCRVIKSFDEYKEIIINQTYKKISDE